MPFDREVNTQITGIVVPWIKYHFFLTGQLYISASSYPTKWFILQGLQNLILQALSSKCPSGLIFLLSDEYPCSRKLISSMVKGPQFKFTLAVFSAELTNTILVSVMNVLFLLIKSIFPSRYKSVLIVLYLSTCISWVACVDAPKYESTRSKAVMYSILYQIECVYFLF